MTSLNNPFFSIIMPVYNGAATIERTISAIVAQDFDDWELLIMDSCSNDATAEIIGKYALDQRIKHIVEKDKGIYDGMNKGLERSSGKWMYFTGCDDHFYNKYILSSIHNRIKERPDLMVIYGKVKFQHSGKEYDRDFDLYRLSYKNICHQAIFYQNLLFEKIGNYNLKYPLHADWDLNLRWIDREPSLFINETIAFYNETGASSTSLEDFSHDLPNRVKDELKLRSFSARLRYVFQKIRS